MGAVGWRTDTDTQTPKYTHRYPHMHTYTHTHTHTEIDIATKRLNQPILVKKKKKFLAQSLKKTTLSNGLSL